MSKLHVKQFHSEAYRICIDNIPISERYHTPEQALDALKEAEINMFNDPTLPRIECDYNIS